MLFFFASADTANSCLEKLLLNLSYMLLDGGTREICLSNTIRITWMEVRAVRGVLKAPSLVLCDNMMDIDSTLSV